MKVLDTALVIDLHADVKTLGAVTIIFTLCNAVLFCAHWYGEKADNVTESQLQISGFVLLRDDYEIFLVGLQEFDKVGGRFLDILIVI